MQKSRDKARKLLKGRISFNKDVLSLRKFNKGRVFPVSVCEKISKANKGKKHSIESRHKMSIAKIDRGRKEFSSEHLRKLRIANIKRIEECVLDGGQIAPSYNRNACMFFDWFDEYYHTTGIYATNGGEYFIAGLGYFIDYLNPFMKLIIEWDEERLHYRNDMFKDKDERRQFEIMQHFPDYEFLRIREKYFDANKLCKQGKIKCAEYMIKYYGLYTLISGVH